MIQNSLDLFFVTFTSCLLLMSKFGESFIRFIKLENNWITIWRSYHKSIQSPRSDCNSFFYRHMSQAYVYCCIREMSGRFRPQCIHKHTHQKPCMIKPWSISAWTSLTDRVMWHKHDGANMRKHAEQHSKTRWNDRHESVTNVTQWNHSSLHTHLGRHVKPHYVIKVQNIITLSFHFVINWRILQ